MRAWTRSTSSSRVPLLGRVCQARFMTNGMVISVAALSWATNWSQVICCSPTFSPRCFMRSKRVVASTSMAMSLKRGRGSRATISSTRRMPSRMTISSGASRACFSMAYEKTSSPKAVRRVFERVVKLFRDFSIASFSNNEPIRALKRKYPAPYSAWSKSATVPFPQPDCPTRPMMSRDIWPECRVSTFGCREPGCY